MSRRGGAARGWAALAAMVVALAAAGCSDDGGDGQDPRRVPRAPATPAEAKAIRAAVVRLFRATDVRVICERSLTPRLFRLIFTGPAACRKATSDDEGDDPPEGVRVAGIRADGRKATAHTTLVGGDTGGAKGRLWLRKGRGGWRTDGFSTAFLRSLLTASLQREREISRAAGRCVDQRLRQMPDGRFRRLAYSLLGRRRGADTRLLQLLTECERRGGGVSSVRRALEKSLRRTLRRAGASPEASACALRRLRGTLPDRLVIELAAEKDPRARARVTREVVAALIACGGGGLEDPRRLTPA